MTTLTVNYRYSDRYKPDYLSNSEIEEVARSVRAQLLNPSHEAVTLESLKSISKLCVNGFEYELWISLDCPVTDRETGEQVCGLCEIDPDAGCDAALLFVSPTSAGMTEELVLSTFAHELGHAIFEAPSWITDSKQGPGLFGTTIHTNRHAYRTTTAHADHLAAVGNTASANSMNKESDLDRSIRFAEYRANEFMGSLLVPRAKLVGAVLEMATKYELTVTPGPSLLADGQPGSVVLKANNSMSAFDLESLQKAAGKRFGVHGRFIKVRMDRYGMLEGSRSN